MASTTSKDGTHIGYEIHGSGPLLICVAGATQYRAVDPDETPALARLLAGDFTVLIYDRRGRGESGDTAPYAVEREIEDIAALIAANGGTARLFGMSSGGVLALEAAAQLGAEIEGLVLYEPPIDPEKSAEAYQRDHAEMAALGAQGKAEEMMVSFLGAIMPEEALTDFRNSPAWPAFASVGRSLEYDYRVLAGAREQDMPPPRWRRIDAPVLVIDGAESFPFMKQGADWVASGLPHAERRTLAGLDHSYDPQILAPLITRFFGKA